MVEEMDSKKTIRLGLDIGSVTAKLAALIPMDSESLVRRAGDLPNFFLSDYTVGDCALVCSIPRPVLGDPGHVAYDLLGDFSTVFDEKNLLVRITGSQGKLVSQLLAIPRINEFRAISRGVIELFPSVKTILEIGGDVSRYIRISFDPSSKNIAIDDFSRNGECAAGTGSFIDQQAARLKYRIEEIGPLVQKTSSTATIAGRCSVFAKSDMIHAQQRGYSPGAIFKGLCEAVVRNYKGTVLHGKELLPQIVFVGGLAANSGVVSAMHKILKIGDDQLSVPDLPMHMGALGCALASKSRETVSIDLAKKEKVQRVSIGYSQKLDLSNVRFADRDLKSTEATPRWAYLGLDIGSVSTNLVLLDQDGGVIDEVYTRTDGRPVEVVQTELGKWNNRWGEKIRIRGVGTTGSGRELIGEIVGADVIYDEITAHKTGSSYIAKKLYLEDVDTIFEIGGQDSKYISIEKGIVVDFAMNEACAAGTGSFLEEQATKMGISIKEEFAELALNAEFPIKMGERCTVFMEKDVTSYLQRGMDKNAIAAGLAFAVVQNYLNRVVRGRKIGDSIYFQGGTAYNRAVAAAFASTLQKEIVVPPHNGVIGAIGAALLAREKMANTKDPSRFRGFDLLKVDFTVHQFTCKFCSNQCSMQECTVDGEKTYWGDKCSDRYRQRRRISQKAVIPDLFEFFESSLMRDIPGPNGLGIRIGMPRAMYFYDRFPFWRTFFGQLGAEIVLSAPTNHHVIKKGRELCVAEPCFPIVVSHGHVADLMDKNMDFIFIPNVMNAETEVRAKESWYCPWGQTLPLVLKNSVSFPELNVKILAPLVNFRDGKQRVKGELSSVARMLGVSSRLSDQAVDMAYAVQKKFIESKKRAGYEALQTLLSEKRQGVVIVGRPYNIYDPGLNMNVPAKLIGDYGIDLIPFDFLPIEGIAIEHIHENMFWNYGRRILQAAVFVGQNDNLSLIYFTNFKCGPDSYIKHFVRMALGAPYLTLQFDDHGNDAGIVTRCEAFLQSKNLLQTARVPKLTEDAIF